MHDSLNPSLAKKCLQRFVADEEYKGNYPDGDLDEVDYPPLLTEDFSVLSVNSPSVFGPIKKSPGQLSKSKGPTITRLRDILHETETSESSSSMRTQIKVDDEWDQLLSRPLHVRVHTLECPSLSAMTIEKDFQYFGKS